MRIKTMLQTTAVLGLAVMVGLLGVGGTWALWSTSVPANMGTVEAADFQVKLNGSSMTSWVGIRPDGALTPTQEVYAMVTVTHDTNASAPFSIEATMPATATTHLSALETDLTVQAVRMTNPTCADASFTAQASNTAVIDRNQTASFCLRMSLPPDAPSNKTPSDVTVTIPVTATQIQ
ncbi:hypothetical protein [Citricoccus muralis]|uniref:Putative ribosomally synthesized peptide with SipW-like signal peptide n=1 Tax=Citricoccus muralis TaxID=169134 RepID=A0A3D9LDI8_9MICC|nr:hypothetical protein [Citricoccus muralis]REE03716.1 putative ribosomally synthesized peptide with SipW-like signal peptide [Citricoccus muralis]